MKSADQWGDDLERRPALTLLKAAVIGTVIALVVAALVGLASTGSIFFKGEAAKLTNPSREKIVVFDPNRTISTYEGFYTLCNEFNANIVKAKAAEQEAIRREKAYNPEADPFGNEQKAINAVREDARALHNQAVNLAAQYNADSSANTRAPFKGADLPYTLDAAGNTPATCGSPKEAQR